MNISNSLCACKRPTCLRNGVINASMTKSAVRSCAISNFGNSERKSEVVMPRAKGSHECFPSTPFLFFSFVHPLVSYAHRHEHRSCFYVECVLYRMFLSQCTNYPQSISESLSLPPSWSTLMLFRALIVFLGTLIRFGVSTTG